jgi:acetate kinase
LGVKIDEEKNVAAGKGEGVVFEITKGERDGKMRMFVVETDEEEQCARMAVSTDRV